MARADGRDWGLRMQHVGENSAAFSKGLPQTDFADLKAARGGAAAN